MPNTPVKSPAFLKGLNAEQSQAVVHTQSSLAVIAGAGSGKTSVLTRRIAWLLDTQQWSAQKILAVTFTNKAAQEMKKRLVHLGVQGVEHMWVGTFHGLAHRFLRKHHEAAGLGAHFQILDAQEQEKVVKKVFKSNQWSVEENDPKDVVRFINAQKDVGVRPAHCATTNAQDVFLKEAYTEYQQWCDSHNWVDFGELLLRCFELMNNNADIRLRYQSQFAHILVDEFQDTNDIQYAWIKLLADAGEAIPTTVVGDMDQSIYSWRGARMTNVQRFVDEFASVGMIKLEQNYRSTHHILTSANALIQNNRQRIAKNLWTDSKSGDPVVLFEATDEKEEAAWVIARATRQYAASKKWADTAILYRSNAQSRIVEEACIQRNIPYKIHGGIRFFERAEIKDALAHLTMLVDVSNDLMLERALTVPAKGFGAKTLDAVRTKAVVEECSWSDVLNNPAHDALLSSKAKTAWIMWRDLWQTHQHMGSLEDKVRWCVEGAGLLAHYQEVDKKDKTDRAENLKELISVARRYSQGRSASNSDIVLDFLASAALEAENAQNDSDDALQLMTIHAAKGLEFPCVCAIGWDEGLFPSAQSLTDPERMEEERRLAYVAITRAEKILCISGAVERRQYGQWMRLAPSRFVAELPPSSAAWSRMPTRANTLKAPMAHSSAPPALPRAAQTTSYWSVGEQVRHPSFGIGKIVRVDGTQRNDRVLIAFQDGQRRVLLPQLAKIEKMK